MAFRFRRVANGSPSEVALVELALLNRRQEESCTRLKRPNLCRP